jgi:hypothetical protein
MLTNHAVHVTAARLQLLLNATSFFERRPVTTGVDMICIATACAKRASKNRLLAQALSKS